MPQIICICTDCSILVAKKLSQTRKDKIENRGLFDIFKMTISPNLCTLVTLKISKDQLWTA